MQNKGTQGPVVVLQGEPGSCGESVTASLRVWSGLVRHVEMLLLDRPVRLPILTGKNDCKRSDSTSWCLFPPPRSLTSMLCSLDIPERSGFTPHISFCAVGKIHLWMVMSHIYPSSPWLAKALCHSSRGGEFHPGYLTCQRLAEHLGRTRCLCTTGTSSSAEGLWGKGSWRVLIAASRWQRGAVVVLVQATPRKCCLLSAPLRTPSLLGSHPSALFASPRI